MSENTDQVAEVASWLAGSNVGEAISEVVALEAEKKLIEEKMKRAKTLVAESRFDTLTPRPATSIAGEGGGSKRDKAEKLDIPILDEAALQAML